MLTYTLRRLLMLIPMLLVITFLIYVGLELTPGMLFPTWWAPTPWPTWIR